VLLYCIQSEGLVDNYFLAQCFHAYTINMFSASRTFALALRNCIIGHEPYKEDCITYTVHIQYLVYHIATG
jgi:hypothetical protein